MTRWTIRNMQPDAIQAIQNIATTTGISLGEALSAAIRHGAGAAIQELRNQNSDLDVVKALEHIQNLQRSIMRELQSLYGHRTA